MARRCELAKVSDKDYIDDFGSRIADTASRTIPSTFSLQYKDDDLYMRLRRKTYQTLRTARTASKCRMTFEPQLNINYKNVGATGYSMPKPNRFISRILIKPTTQKAGGILLPEHEL